MPLEIIVASWRVMIEMSPSFTRLNHGSSMSLFDLPLVGDVEDDEALGLELVGDGLLGLGVDLAVGLAPADVDGLEDVRAHHMLANESAPSRRRSSSGVDERASASCWVILPERTSVASAASIVCMPSLPPVCSDE